MLAPVPLPDIIMRNALIALFLGLSLAAFAASGPYDESADARADIQRALVAAKAANLPVLVVFGANWCADCKVLDGAFKSGPAAALIGARFQVVKVNVGRFNVNTDVADAYGVPLKQGIPTVAVLSPQGQVVYASTGGELADARHMGDQAIYDFFVKVSGTHR